MMRFIVLAFAMLSSCAAQMPAGPVASSPATLVAGALTRQQAGPLMPGTVFFRGQTATTQARNSAGVKFPDGKLLLTALVDTAGYSSSLKETYQAYLLTEVAVDFGGRVLAPGAYGFGFITGNQAVVMDIGGNELFRVATMRDEASTRPVPLQIVAGDADGTYKLYLGRNEVTLKASAK